MPTPATCRTCSRKSLSATSSASSTQASTCSAEGSSGRSGAAAQRANRAGLGSSPAKTSAVKSSMIWCRSAADRRASLLIMPISVPSAERFTTAATTARRSRSDPDLGVQRLQVDGGHLRGGDLAAQYAPDIGQAHAQLPQGRHQFQPGHAGRVVQPAIAVRPRSRRHQPAIRPEPDGAHRHANPPGQLTDRQKRSIVLHGASLALPVTGEANPTAPGSAMTWLRSTPTSSTVQVTWSPTATSTAGGPSATTSPGIRVILWLPRSASSCACPRTSSPSASTSSRASSPGRARAADQRPLPGRDANRCFCAGWFRQAQILGQHVLLLPFLTQPDCAPT